MSLMVCSNLLNIGETAAEACDETRHCAYWFWWHFPQYWADVYCLSAVARACGSFSGKGFGSSWPRATPAAVSRDTTKASPGWRIKRLLVERIKDLGRCDLHSIMRSACVPNTAV